MTARARWIIVAVAGVLLLAIGFTGGLITPGLRAPGNDSPEAGFARDMSVHHAQAVQMSVLALTRVDRPDILGLAHDIALTQQAQIGMMAVWLQDWHLQPTGTRPPMAWMGDGARVVNGLMPGMATPAQIQQLTDSKGTAADILYCQLMLRHHVGGIHMVRDILKLTSNSQVRSLAQAMLTGQQLEVVQFQDFLQQLGALPLTS